MYSINKEGQYIYDELVNYVSQFNVRFGTAVKNSLLSRVKINDTDTYRTLDSTGEGYIPYDTVVVYKLRDVVIEDSDGKAVYCKQFIEDVKNHEFNSEQAANTIKNTRLIIRKLTGKKSKYSRQIIQDSAYP